MKKVLVSNPLVSRGLRTFSVLFVMFALFTGFAPCKYASFRSVERHLGLVASAADGGPDECDCNPAGIYTDQSKCWRACSVETEYGCGLLWVIPCNRLYGAAEMNVVPGLKSLPGTPVGQPLAPKPGI